MEKAKSEPLYDYSSMDIEVEYNLSKFLSRRGAAKFQPSIVMKTKAIVDKIKSNEFPPPDVFIHEIDGDYFIDFRWERTGIGSEILIGEDGSLYAHLSSLVPECDGSVIWNAMWKSIDIYATRDTPEYRKLEEGSTL